MSVGAQWSGVNFQKMEVGVKAPATSGAGVAVETNARGWALPVMLVVMEVKRFDVVFQPPGGGIIFREGLPGVFVGVE